ncbi:MAG: DUF2935 domain-containing protein [Clostridia bacterium]|nr:DUF2935 domain-containing protein [Clostridia bacterium]
MIDLREDLLFWTGIMRDHAMFQLSTLAPKETMYIQHATYYRDFFQRMMCELERTCDWRVLQPTLLQGLICFIEFKKTLLRGLLTCCLQINLSPSLINHQINEAMEFEALLTTPVVPCVNKGAALAEYTKIWLTDSIGHAASIPAFLDPSEALLAEEAEKFKMKFDKLFIKASELQLMLDRTGLQDGTLELLAEETIEWMSKFICYLEKLKELRAKCKALAIGTMLPLIPDHFIREHRYFIRKLKMYMMG